MKVNRLTIKLKLIMVMVISLLASTALEGYVIQSHAYQVVYQRLIGSELPAKLLQIRNKIDKEISLLLAAVEQQATNSFILDAYKQEMTPKKETQLVQQLNKTRTQYGLVDAAVANRNTGDYWNQKGFLRRLNHQQDGWFYDFVSSNEESTLSVIREPNGDIKLFLSYQQLDGLGMAGLSKSLDEMVRFIDQFQLEQTGFVYLVDNNGTVRLHTDSSNIDNTAISQLYGHQAANTLLAQSDFNFAEVELNGRTTLVASSYIPSFGWFVVAELPKAEAFAVLDEGRNKIVLWTVVIILIFGLVAIWLAGNITKPVQRLANVFKDLGEGEGDLRHRIEVQGQDEIAQLSEGFNSFISKIHHSVKEVADTGDALRSAAASVATQAQSTLDNCHDQRDRTLQVTTAIHEMGATVNEIAGNAAQAADVALGAEDETSNNQNVVDQARETINQLVGNVDQVSEVIESLAINTQAIGSILDVIRGISEQTNLLALNAAIEAARAGEHGRGFAVVADEVRNLASRTADSTDEIQLMINKLQEEAGNAVAAVAQNRDLISESVSANDKTSNALVSIAARITQIADMNTQVATATEEQSTVIDNINQTIEEINNTTHYSTNTTELLVKSSHDLRELSRRLESMVGTFKL